MKQLHEMTPEEAFDTLSVSLDVGGIDMRVGLLPKHAAIKRGKKCTRSFVRADGEVIKCGKFKTPHYCEPRVAHILDAWGDLVLVKPPHLNMPYEPIGWNLEKIKQFYGVVIWDPFFNMWVRLYQMVYIVGTRGNKKSVFLSGNGLVLLANLEPGSEMVLVSQTQQRTEETVAGYMKNMIKLSPALQELGLEYLSSKMKFIRSDPDAPDVECSIMTARVEGTVLGKRLSAIIVDEFDAVHNFREFWRDATYSWGLQPEPIGIMASTVAEDYASYEAETTEKMRDVEEMPWLEPRTIPVLKIAPEGSNWRDRKVWLAANEHIGEGLLDDSTLDVEYLRSDGNPQLESDFARFRVGVRLSPHSSYIPMSIWDRNEHMPYDLKENPGALDAYMDTWPNFLGVDFGEVSDWTACVKMCMTGDYYMCLRGWFWIPRRNIEPMDKRLGGRVSQWINEGWLRIMEDGQVGIHQVAKEISKLADEIPDMRAIGYDPAKALAARTVWEEDGHYCDGVAQGHRIQEGALEIRHRAYDDKLIHGNDPVLRYFFESAELKLKTMDNKEIVKPDRGVSSRRVDGAVAAATAVYMRLLHYQYAPQGGPAGSTGDILWTDMDGYDEDETGYLTVS